MGGIKYDARRKRTTVPDELPYPAESAFTGGCDQPHMPLLVLTTLKGTRRFGPDNANSRRG